MKDVRYTVGAARDLKRYGNVAARIRSALHEYAGDSLAHANNVTQLVGLSGYRLRVGDFRVLFEESATAIIVTKIGPRGSVYD